MTDQTAFIQPGSTDARAICERLDTIIELLENVLERNGTQGIGWDGGGSPADAGPRI